MRIASVAVAAWLAALTLAVSTGAVAYRELPDRADLKAMTLLTLVAGAVLAASCYVPGLMLIRRRTGKRLTALQAALATGAGLNVPAFLILAFLATRMNVFAPGEALWFASMFLMFGLAFGAGYARYCQPAA